MCACYAKHAASVLSVASRRAHQFDAGVRRGVLQRFDRTQSQQRSFRHLATNRSRGDPQPTTTGTAGGGAVTGATTPTEAASTSAGAASGGSSQTSRAQTRPPAPRPDGSARRPGADPEPEPATVRTPTRHCHSAGEYAVTGNVDDRTLSVVPIGAAAVATTVQLDMAPGRHRRRAQFGHGHRRRRLRHSPHGRRGQSQLQ